MSAHPGIAAGNKRLRVRPRAQAELVQEVQFILGRIPVSYRTILILRDLEGCVHFLPNGGISSVTNMTHGWSRWRRSRIWA